MARVPGRRSGGSDVPTYVQVANHVRLLITTGRVAVGEQLPSENDLATKFETTRSTVREGMRILIHEGLVVSIKTKGYFVRDQRQIVWPMTTRDSLATSARSAVDPWLTVVERDGWTGRQTIEVGVVEAASHRVCGVTLADQLDVGPSGRVVVRRRVRYITREDEPERPQELADSYFVYDVVKDTAIMGEADIQPSVFHVLEGVGYVRAGFEDVIGSRMPTQSEILKLELLPGTPVLETVRQSRFLPDDRILHLRHSIYTVGNRLSYEVGA